MSNKISIELTGEELTEINAICLNRGLSFSQFFMNLYRKSQSACAHPPEEEPAKAKKKPPAPKKREEEVKA